MHGCHQGKTHHKGLMQSDKGRDCDTTVKEDEGGEVVK